MMNQRETIRQLALHHDRIDRRTLVTGMTGSAAAIGILSWKYAGFAQEAELNPGPANPTALGPAVPPELTEFAHDWPAPQGNLAGTRATTDSPIDSSNVAELGVAWTWPIEAAGAFGGMTAPAIVVGETIYVQDMESNVFAIARDTGEVRWEHRYETPTEGPNGVAVGYGMIYGSTGDTAQVFALDAATGEEIWRVDLNNNPGMGIDIAPSVYDNIVYVSTVPGASDEFYEGGQSGIFYAVDAATGAPLWPWDTTAGEPTDQQLVGLTVDQQRWRGLVSSIG